MSINRFFKMMAYFSIGIVTLVLGQILSLVFGWDLQSIAMFISGIVLFVVGIGHSL